MTHFLEFMYKVNVIFVFFLFDAEMVDIADKESNPDLGWCVDFRRLEDHYECTTVATVKSIMEKVRLCLSTYFYVLDILCLQSVLVVTRKFYIFRLLV